MCLVQIKIVEINLAEQMLHKMCLYSGALERVVKVTGAIKDTAEATMAGAAALVALGVVVKLAGVAMDISDC